MSALSPFELDIATLIVSTLNLELRPEDIDPQAPLFNEGLGLDSIDALELALEISQRYGFQIRSDDDNVGEIFRSLRALAGFIETKRAA